MTGREAAEKAVGSRRVVVGEVGPQGRGEASSRRAATPQQPALASYTRRSSDSGGHASGWDCTRGSAAPSRRERAPVAQPQAPEPADRGPGWGWPAVPSRQMPIGVCSSLWPSGLSSKLRSSSRTRSFGSVLATHHAGLMSLMSQIAMS